MSPLEFAKGTLEAGNVTEKAATEIKPHEAVDGRPTYVVSIDRPIDSYHCEILIDQATDLPIRADMTVDYSKDGNPTFGVQNLHQEFKFNQPLDDRLFEFTSTKPIVDMRKEQYRLAQLWAKPVAQAQRVAIRDVSSTTDGRIWIAYTAGGQALPSRLTTDTGETYLRGFDYCPNSMNSNGGMKLSGEALTVTEFVPLKTTGRSPHTAMIGLADRPSALPNFAQEARPIESPIGADLKVPVTQLPQCFPLYFYAANLARTTFELPTTMWDLRGRRFEADGDWRAAAQAYEECAKSYKNLAKYEGFRPLLKAATCYRKLGDTDTADRLEQQAAILKAGLER